MLGMRSALSTIETKQVNYQIFICIFFSMGNEPAYGDTVVRYWGKTLSSMPHPFLHQFNASVEQDKHL